MRTAGLFIFALLFPVFAHATALININTANATLLDTLPGIGPSKAAAIIDYRTQHGSFASIQDIQSVSGIGPSTYAEITPLITVGDAAPSAPPADEDSTASSTPPVATSTSPVIVSSSSSAPAEYLPIPMLRIITAGDRTVSSGADVAFTASVYDSKGNKRDDALVTWSFGDGMRKIGASVFHEYYGSGEYLAIVRAATSDGGDVSDEMIITAKDAGIKITLISPRGITLANTDSRTLNLSLWRLSMGGQEFKIPEDTQILAGHTILFPSQVIELPVADSALLLYPSGEVAAAYPTSVPVKLSSFDTSTSRVQVVEPITSANGNVQNDAEAVIAPATTIELAAAGATLPSPVAMTSATRSHSNFLTSPWTLGLFGIVALAGGAFILL